VCVYIYMCVCACVRAPRVCVVCLTCDDVLWQSEDANNSLLLSDPKVNINPNRWFYDEGTIAVMGTVGGALLLLAIVAGFWYSKSRHRHLERLERRNSIRQSLHSIRSVGLATPHGGFTELGMRKKPTSVSVLGCCLVVVCRLVGWCKMIKKAYHWLVHLLVWDVLIYWFLSSWFLVT
jgi:hypothetical protein